MFFKNSDYIAMIIIIKWNWKQQTLSGEISGDLKIFAECLLTFISLSYRFEQQHIGQ